MLKKIKVILSYIFQPNYIIKGIKNPERIINFLKKDLIFEPKEFVVQLTGETSREVSKYIKEINEKEEFNDYIWERYNDFEKQLTDENKIIGAGGVSKEMGIILYALVRILKPDVVLETGVASGISSAYILSALEENKKGKLISIDLPYQEDKQRFLNYIQAGVKTFIPKEEKPGWLIPEDLKKKWQLVLGRSSEKLPIILKELPRIDIFIHDSEHSYENMIWEFQTVWPRLRKDGLLISHDVKRNRAFDDFSEEIKGKGREYREEFGVLKKL